MAYRMFLKGADFDRNAWLRELKSRGVTGLFSGLCCQLRDQYPSWHRQNIWLHPLDGIGGVTLRQSEEDVELVIPDSCALADVLFAWKLLTMGKKHGAIASDEAHEVLELNDQEISEVTHSIRKKGWSNLIAEIQRSGEFSLRIGDIFTMRVNSGDTGCGSIDLERGLLERMRRYSHAVIAGVTTSGVGSTSSTSIYCQVPTLISSKVDDIFIRIEGVPYFSAPVPAQRFYQVLKPFVEDLGDWKYVPAIDLGARPDLILALNKHDVISGVPCEKVGAEDWARLAKAPCLVFLMVVAAEGQIAEREIELFEKLLNHPDQAPSPLVSKIISITQRNLECFIDEILTSETTPPMQMLEICSLLASDKLGTHDGKDYANFLYHFAEDVASASGGLFGLGPRISKDKAEVLRSLRMLLLLNNREFRPAAMGES
jgi:hypothetical protein